MVNRGGAKDGREREREEFSLGGNECPEQERNIYIRTHVLFSYMTYYVPCVLIKEG